MSAAWPGDVVTALEEVVCEVLLLLVELETSLGAVVPGCGICPIIVISNRLASVVVQVDAEIAGPNDDSLSREIENPVRLW